jgi:tRNA 2-thiouridine synthesizing protein A
MADKPSLFRDLGAGRYHLDLTGYGCPHVQLYAEKAIARLKPGEALTVVFDSPASGESVAWIADAAGDIDTDKETRQGTFIWQLRRR